MGGTIFCVLAATKPPGRTKYSQRRDSRTSKAQRMSARPSSMSGEWTSGPKRTWELTTPPRWLMPCTSLFLASSPNRRATSEMTSLARMIPWPPTPTSRMLVMPLFMAYSPFSTGRMAFTGQTEAHSEQPVHRSRLTSVLAKPLAVFSAEG